MPDEDDLADKYDLADDRLTAAGLGWYEVSNWARDDAARCRHNELYWANANWWGVGPGAHSHVGGLRWWNVKHPAAYADRLARGESPHADAELLDDAGLAGVFDEAMARSARLYDAMVGDFPEQAAYGVSVVLAVSLVVRGASGV